MEIDSKTIKALSAETRIRILKILRGSRRIAADISKEIGLAPSTVNEHLKLMEEAGLVRKNETGHKWIYYEITEKGKNMITPKMPISIILTLSLGIGLALFGGMSFFAANVFYQESGMAQSVMQESAKAAEAAAAGAGAAQLSIPVPAADLLPVIILVVGAALIVFGLIMHRRMK